MPYGNQTLQQNIGSTAAMSRARSGQGAAMRTGLMQQAQQTGQAQQPQGQPAPGAGQAPTTQTGPGGIVTGSGSYQHFLSHGSAATGAPQAMTANAPGLPGTTSISELGTYLGRMYGLDIGGGGLFDDEGTAMRTPRNADEAAAFNLISQRLADEKNKQSMKKAESALQQQQGLLQRGGRGSLQAYSSGTFGQMADLYSQQQFNPTDFGYWIAKEFQEKQERLVRDQMRAMKKAAKYKMYGDIATGITTAAVFCWVAEELFGKWDERTVFARLYCSYHKDEPFFRLYKRFGRFWAKTLRVLPFLKPLVRPIWASMARKGEKIYTLIAATEE